MSALFRRGSFRILNQEGQGVVAWAGALPPPTGLGRQREREREKARLSSVVIASSSSSLSLLYFPLICLSPRLSIAREKREGSKTKKRPIPNIAERFKGSERGKKEPNKKKEPPQPPPPKPHTFIVWNGKEKKKIEIEASLLTCSIPGEKVVLVRDSPIYFALQLSVPFKGKVAKTIPFHFWEIAMIGGSSLPRGPSSILFPFPPFKLELGAKRERTRLFSRKEHFCLLLLRTLSVPWVLGSTSPLPSLPHLEREKN